MKIFRCRDANRLCSVSFALLVFLMLASTSHASKLRHLWQSSDQFVALELQDSVSTGPVQPNDHPIELTLDRIIAILASIDIQATGDGKPEPLFTRSAVQVLAPHLLQGLRQASPKEDVTFAVIGLHGALHGLAKSPKVTTGRVFYKEGRLNIIVGLAQQEVRDRDDRRLFPFTPGARQKASEGEWRLLAQPARKGCTLERKDWVIFSDEWQEPAAELSAPAQPGKGTNDGRTAAERLTALKDLRDKGLISEEEYQKKRAQILDGL
jgi:Short C-terminal domain